MDAYKVLGLTEGATEVDFKTAYRALAQKYNPDNYEAGRLREEAEAKMTELNEAFDALRGASRTGTPAICSGRLTLCSLSTTSASSAPLCA